MAMAVVRCLGMAALLLLLCALGAHRAAAQPPALRVVGGNDRCAFDTLSTESVVGIDLGTTMSLVAQWGYANGRDSPVLKNSYGQALTPSFVGVKETGEFLIGTTAYDNYELNPDTTFSSIKRILGRRITHPDIAAQKTSKYYNIVDCNDHWPSGLETIWNEIDEWFPDSANDAGHEKPTVDLEKIRWRKHDHAACLSFPYKDSGTLVLPVEFVSALVLADLRITAQTQLQRRITQAVVTVPAYFTEKQKAATLDAARMAGFEVLRLLPEPTAAAYFYEEKLNTDARRTGNVLVFDLGGGTFDVSILKFEKGQLMVRAIDGDNHCGGDDVDDLLRAFLERKIRVPLSVNAKVSLQKEVERKKQHLSKQNSATVIGNFMNPPFKFELTRAILDQECAPFFARLMPVVNRAMHSLEMTPSDIDFVLMVGGSSRLRKVRSMMEDFIGSTDKFRSMNEDESVGIGASVMAFRFANVNQQIKGSTGGITTTLELDGAFINDALPHSLGTIVHIPKDPSLPNGDRVPENSILIPRMTMLPAARASVYVTVRDYQTRMRVEITEGDEADVGKNDILGEFLVENLRALPHGEAKVNLTYSLDTNGILKVTARELGGTASADYTLTNVDWSRIESTDEMDVMQHVLHRILRTSFSYQDLEANYHRC